MEEQLLVYACGSKVGVGGTTVTIGKVGAAVAGADSHALSSNIVARAKNKMAKILFMFFYFIDSTKNTKQHEIFFF